MHVTVISRLAAAVAGVWVAIVGPAWAEGGGEDLGALQAIIGAPDGSSGLCKMLGLPTCPQIPTITQAVLEISGLENAPPEMVRALNNVPPGSRVDAGNPSHPPATGSITLPVPPDVISDLLSGLTPIGFISSTANRGQATPARLDNPDANSFFYAVASGLPDTLYFFYDFVPLKAQRFVAGQEIARITVPLSVLQADGITERPVPTTVRIRAVACNGASPPCIAADAIGDFSGSGAATRSATDILGPNSVALVFVPSPASTHPHAILEVAVPILLTMATDPEYFIFPTYPPTPYLPTTFRVDIGFVPDPATPPILGSGLAIGITPHAVPLCTGGKCPVPPAPSTFSLCASLLRNSEDDHGVRNRDDDHGEFATALRGRGAGLQSAVGAFLAIAVDGETLISAPLPPVPQPQCPF